MTDKERAAFNNLILLCRAHHDLIDNKHPEQHSVAVLQGWKQAREAEAGQALSELGAIDPDDLERLFVDAAVIHLGGQGGSAPGAGGGGGGSFGSGTGGPGGPGGNTYILDGTPGTAPGAGGGGAGAIAPDLPGEGGGGGEYVKKRLAVNPGDIIRCNVGEDGKEGQAGDEVTVEVVDRKTEKVKDVVRAKGGRAGRSGNAIRDEEEGPAVVITSAFLADVARIRNGLIHVIGGGWDHVIVEELPVATSGSIVVIAEPLVTEARETELLFEMVDPNGNAEKLGALTVDVSNPDRPLRIPGICHFTVEPTTSGTWSARVLSGGVELATIPFRVIERKQD
jgi:hypothetical protein